MAQRIRAADVLRSLQARSSQLMQEVTALSASKRTLLLRNALLSSWCEALSYVQMHCGIQQPDGMGCDAGDGRFEKLLETEMHLLQQLSNKAGPLGAHASLEQLLQPDSSTIAPSTDPMAYLTRFACQAPSEERLSMDGQAVASVYQRTAQAVGLKLHQLATATPCEHPGLVKQLADAWEPYMQCLYDLIMSGKVCAIEEALMHNLDTMQLEPAAAAAHQAAQSAKLVPLLQLTEQQQELIPIATELYYDLVAANHRERQQINSQMTAVLEAAAADSAAEAAASTSASTSASGDAGFGRLGSSMACSRVHATRYTSQDLPDHRARLQQQEALTTRLNQLLHKEYKLRLAAMGWFVGTLTYEQLSLLAVVSWPYGMRLLFLATEIMQQSRVPVTASPNCTSSGS